MTSLTQMRYGSRLRRHGRSRRFRSNQAMSRRRSKRNEVGRILLSPLSPATRGERADRATKKPPGIPGAVAVRGGSGRPRPLHVLAKNVGRALGVVLLRGRRLLLFGRLVGVVHGRHVEDR